MYSHSKALAASRSSVNPGHVESVHSLRGLAALAVAICHFTCGNPSFYVPSIVKSIGANGRLGVDVFFVISGFILPYSLWRAGYRLSLSNFRRFLWKRVVRLDPPYLTTVGLVLLLWYLSSHTSGFRGAPFHINPTQVALHVAYLNAFTSLPWLNPVFWTLAVECQFYLLIALVFPLVVSRHRASRLMIIGSLLFAPLLYSSTHLVIHYLPLFSCGIVAFQGFAGICSGRETRLLLLLSAGFLWMNMGAIIMAVGLVTALIIVRAPLWTNASLAFLGTLSYSLYLLHVPIGGRIVNLATRLSPSGVTGMAVVAMATAISIGAAYVLNRFVERPAQRYAGSLRFMQEAPSRCEPLPVERREAAPKERLAMQ